MVLVSFLRFLTLWLEWGDFVAGFLFTEIPVRETPCVLVSFFPLGFYGKGFCRRGGGQRKWEWYGWLPCVFSPFLVLILSSLSCLETNIAAAAAAAAEFATAT